jgi:hypothetical protein
MTRGRLLNGFFSVSDALCPLRLANTENRFRTSLRSGLFFSVLPT